MRRHHDGRVCKAVEYGLEVFDPQTTRVLEGPERLMRMLEELRERTRLDLFFAINKRNRKILLGQWIAKPLCFKVLESWDGKRELLGHLGGRGLAWFASLLQPYEYDVRRRVDAVRAQELDWVRQTEEENKVADATAQDLRKRGYDKEAYEVEAGLTPLATDSDLEGDVWRDVLKDVEALDAKRVFKYFGKE